MAQTVRNLPPLQEIRVQSLGWEDLLEEGTGNPLQYSCLENPMDGGAWGATVHGVTKELDTTEQLTLSHFSTISNTYMVPTTCHHCYKSFIHLFIYLFLLYNIVLVLPCINMNLPRVYTCSPSWTPLPPLSSYHPSGSSQCTSPEHPVSCIESGLVIHFTCDIIHVSMPFSQIIPPSPSLTESNSLSPYMQFLSLHLSNTYIINHFIMST